MCQTSSLLFSPTLSSCYLPTGPSIIVSIRYHRQKETNGNDYKISNLNCIPMFTRCHDKYFDTLGTVQTRHKSISCCLFACSSIAIFEGPLFYAPGGAYVGSLYLPALTPPPKSPLLLGDLSCLISCLFGILLHSLIIAPLI